VRHDNLNAFIGTCVDPGAVCVLSEYCSRGSLFDILGNQCLKLDSMFVASIVFDILKVRCTATTIDYFKRLSGQLHYTFKWHLDKFSSDQDVLYNYKADLMASETVVL